MRGIQVGYRPKTNSYDGQVMALCNLTRCLICMDTVLSPCTEFKMDRCAFSGVDYRRTMQPVKLTLSSISIWWTGVHIHAHRLTPSLFEDYVVDLATFVSHFATTTLSTLVPGYTLPVKY